VRSDESDPSSAGHDDSLQVAGSRIASDLIARGASLSGLERNRFFYNREGSEFLNLSELSGLDIDSDTRTHVHLDYDRDGWPDVALVNANPPLLQIFRNTIGDRDVPERFVALRFVGGNGTLRPSPGRSSRDAYGAKVRLRFEDGFQIMREHRAGDGFAAQNSSTLLVGVGDRSCVPALDVRWPSGLTQRITDVPTGHLVTLFEGSDDPTQEEHAAIRPYADARRYESLPGGTRPRCPDAAMP